MSAAPHAHATSAAVRAAPAGFAFFAPARCYEDLSKADSGQQRRIGGIASTEARDVQGEDVLQKGINWEDALGVRGFFNNDHRKGLLDLLGAPQRVQLVEPGDKFPDGQVAKHRSTWVEGYLFDTEDGRKTWDLAKAMQGSGRQLGFSIEGQVEERTGPAGMTIARARIQHIAITHQPVNTDCRLETLLRSLGAKSLAVGQGTGEQDSVAARSGRAMTREQLDDKVLELDVGGRLRRARPPARRRARAASAQKSLTTSSVFTNIYTHLPHASADYACALGRALQRQGHRRS